MQSITICHCCCNHLIHFLAHEHMAFNELCIITQKKLQPPISSPCYKSHPKTTLHESQARSQQAQEEEEEAQSKRPVVQKMKGTVAAAVVVAVLAVAFLATASHGAVTCGDVDASLRPCVGYVTGKEAAPPAECCEGVRRLRALPTSTAERRFACDCVKKAAARYKGLSSDAIRDLPAACGSPLPFPLALDFDCNTIP